MCAAANLGSVREDWVGVRCTQFSFSCKQLKLKTLVHTVDSLEASDGSDGQDISSLSSHDSSSSGGVGSLNAVPVSQIIAARLRCCKEHGPARCQPAGPEQDRPHSNVACCVAPHAGKPAVSRVVHASINRVY